jgi:hypothetical protein
MKEFRLNINRDHLFGKSNKLNRNLVKNTVFNKNEFQQI